MGKILGIGGVFFKSPVPEGLRAWYSQALGLPAAGEGGSVAFLPDAMPANGCTVWSPFSADTAYFSPSQKEFMINFVVDDLDGSLEQVAEAGGQIVGTVEEYEYGRFGWFLDPDGNKVELWQPAG